MVRISDTLAFWLFSVHGVIRRVRREVNYGFPFWPAKDAFAYGEFFPNPSKFIT
jgi:hypothetical protein